MPGLNNLIRRIRQIQSNAQTLDGIHQVPAGQLFNNAFMRTHTEFSNFADFSTASPCELRSDKDFEAPAELDGFVRDRTRFSSWQEMFRQAVHDWAEQRLMGDAPVDTKVNVTPTGGQ